MDFDTNTLAILAVGVALATLIMRSTARLDAERRDLARAMETFRKEMLRLAERQVARRKAV